MYNDDFEEEDFEPSKEEWDEIEELILQEELDERKETRKEKAADLFIFKNWCKENGILW